MKAKVAKWGNSVGIRFPKLLAQDLGLTPGREVELRQNGSQVMIETSSGRKIPTYRLEDLLVQIKPGQKSPPLEDWSVVEPPWPNDDWSDIAPTDEEMGIIPRRKRVSSRNANRRRKRA